MPWLQRRFGCWRLFYADVVGCCLGGLAPVIVIISDKTVREVDLGANLRRLDVSAKIGELWRAFSYQVSS